MSAEVPQEFNRNSRGQILYGDKVPIDEMAEGYKKAHDLAIKERDMAVGEGSILTSMAMDAERKASLWDSREHFEANADAYRQNAEEAQAAGKEIVHLAGQDVELKQ